MLLFDRISPYGLVYLLGFVLLCILQLKSAPNPATTKRSLTNTEVAAKLCKLCYIFLFSLIGARLGYALFYEYSYFKDHLFELFLLYKGGMSFHGAVCGLIVGILLVERKFENSLLMLDRCAFCALICLPLGRICNFFNSEIFGTVTTQNNPFAVIFSGLDLQLRHPVSLYEGAALSLVLLPLLLILRRKGRLAFTGAFACAFSIGYGLLRFFVDFMREPDLSVGYIALDLSLGQIFCLIQFLLSLILFFLLKKFSKSPRYGKTSS